MKKLLFGAALAVSMLSSANAQTTEYGLVGGFNGWSLENAVMFTYKGDNTYTLEMDELAPGFKIVANPTSGRWDVQYGAPSGADLLVVGETFEVSVKDGADPANIDFANNVSKVSNAKLTFVPEELSLLITGDITVSYPELWCTGSFCGWNEPGTGESVKMEMIADGVYQCKANFGKASEETPVEFKFAGAGWAPDFCMDGYESYVIAEDGTYTVVRGGSNLVSAIGGELTLTLDINALTLTVGDYDGPVNPSPYPVTADTFGLVGGFNDWSLENAAMFTAGEDGNYTLSLAELTPGFKILGDPASGSWDVQYGAPYVAEPLVIGEIFELATREDYDPSNIDFANNVSKVENAVLTFNPANRTLLVEGDAVVAYPELWCTGGFCSWAAPGYDGAVRMTMISDGVYQCTVDFGDENEFDTIEFKFAGRGWAPDFCMSGSDFYLIEDNGTYPVVRGGDNLVSTIGGELTLTLDINAMTLTVGDYDGPVNPNPYPVTADNFGLVGGFNGWSLETAAMFTAGEDGNYTLSLAELTPGFKIVGDPAYGSWDVQYGAPSGADMLVIGETFELSAKDGSDPYNIDFANNVSKVENAVLTFNPAYRTLIVEGNAVAAYPDLWCTGSFCIWNEPGTGESVRMTMISDGVYQCTVDFGEVSEGAPVEFKFVGMGWAPDFCMDGYDTYVIDGNGTYPVVRGGSNLVSAIGGELTLTLDINAMTLTVGDYDGPVNPNPTPDPETTFGLVGGFNGWSLETAVMFTAGEDGNYTLSLAELTPGFKIVGNPASGTWDINYGADPFNKDQLVLGETFQLTAWAIGLDPYNIEFAGNVVKVTNAKLTFNPERETLLVTGEPVVAYPELWCTGSFCYWEAPGSDDAVRMMMIADGVYQCTVDFGDSSEDAPVQFKFVGMGWAPDFCMDGYDPYVIDGNGTYTVVRGGSNLVSAIGGELTLTLDINAMTLTVGDYDGPVNPNPYPVTSDSFGLVGGFNDWSLDNAAMFTAGEDGNYTLSLAELTGGFKIVGDPTVTYWDVQYGAPSGADLLVIGETFELSIKEDYDPANIDFANNVSKVENAVLTFNPAYRTLLIEGNAVVSYPDLWCTGSFCGWYGPGTGESVKMEMIADGIYQCKANFGEASEDSPVEFKFAGLGWAPDFCMDGYDPYVIDGAGTYAVVRGGSNLVAAVGGMQTLTLDINKMELTIGEYTGVDGIVAEDEEPVYITLDGLRVSNPENGLYIVKTGSKVEKKLIRK